MIAEGEDKAIRGCAVMELAGREVDGDEDRDPPMGSGTRTAAKEVTVSRSREHIGLSSGRGEPGFEEAEDGAPGRGVSKQMGAITNTGGEGSANVPRKQM